jgi:hypothetical protein
MRERFFSWLACRLYPYLLDRLIERERHNRSKLQRVVSLAEKIKQQAKGD